MRFAPYPPHQNVDRSRGVFEAISACERGRMMTTGLTAGTLLLDRYSIVREIGRGGMAVVYLARDEQLGRDVAIKVLPPDTVHEDAAPRFEQEIRTAAGLGHPHVLDVYTSGQYEDSLFYVTRYVEGESLRDRIRRDGPLPIEEALSIGRSIAAALAHAHARGVIHRDVKPGNILLDTEGNAYLADFGIAKALEEVADAPNTMTGKPLGTPEYMSPEQISGDASAATDVYALACVVYEMLAGERPYPDSRSAAALAAHLVKPAPSVQSVRPSVAKWLDDLLRTAMAKEVDLRPSAGGFAEALQLSAETTESAGPPGRRATGVRTSVAVVVISALTVSAWLASKDRSAGADLDPLRVAVLPDRTPAAEASASRAAAGLRRWADLEVVELPGTDAGQVGQAAAAVGAGQYLLARGNPSDGAEVTVELWHTMDDTPIGQLAIAVPESGGPPPEVMDRALQTLLFGTDGFVHDSVYPSAERSFEAQTAFVQGRRARQSWAVFDAERNFRRAHEADHSFASARLWHAQVLHWQGRPASEWRIEADRAAAQPERLTYRDGVLAAALVAMAEDRHPEACSLYAQLISTDSTDFAARFGLGACQARDPVVVRDRSSPTGWSFRGSAHSGVTEFQLALSNIPTRHFDFGAGGFELIQSMLFVHRNSIRNGRAVHEGGGVVVGFPEWRGDSLAMVAVPVAEAGSFAWNEEAARLAELNQRRVLLEIAQSWVLAFPDSPDATYALGVAKELVGDPSALDAYASAANQSPEPDLATLIAASAASLWIRHSIPDDTVGLRRGVALGDSLLERAETGRPRVLSSLAALAMLMGRPTEAARLARDAVVESPEAHLHREGDGLVAFATFGWPVDSMAAITRRIESSIPRSVDPERASAVRRDLLEYATILAYPHHDIGFFSDGTSPGSNLARAVALSQGGHHREAQSHLPTIGHEVGWDVATTHAELLYATSDTAAVAFLEEHLTGAKEQPPDRTRGMARAGSLFAAVALRAQLAQSPRDELRGSRWQAVFRILSAAAEPGLLNPSTPKLESADR